MGTTPFDPADRNDQTQMDMRRWCIDAALRAHGLLCEQSNGKLGDHPQTLANDVIAMASAFEKYITRTGTVPDFNKAASTEIITPTTGIVGKPSK